ncbi:MAG: extracellular catalytic domain type 2 short-chain-length polyhydroxyalkanoate depolymerase [Burkholderiaceae bacterium]
MLFNKESLKCATLATAGTIICVAALFVSPAYAVSALGAYNADPSQSTVSGLSSGGFMANQLGYAYSATFKGVGVFAGGPYMCAGHSSYSSCMYNATISSSMLSTMQSDITNYSSNGTIDNKSNIANQKIFMFVGNSDSTVGPNVMTGAKTQYTNSGVTSSNLQYVNQSSPTTAHTFPTDFDSTGNNSCSSASSPYISNCSYDGAKAALTQFYGTLNARNNSPDYTNNLKEFDQTAFTTNAGIASSGYIYVPSNCASGSVCKVHVALHGCLQYYGTIGDKFLKNTGYARWADTNNIIVLFPQTKADNTSHSTSASGSLANSNGCWDWVGWYGTNFAQKAGTQAAAIKAMVDKITSGYTGGTTTTTTAATTTTTTGGATTTTTAGATTTTTAGATTTTTTATTTTTTAGGACYTASNYTHTISGRAYALFGITYANGSNQNLGAWNIFTTSKLRKTGTNYYVKDATCP